MLGNVSFKGVYKVPVVKVDEAKGNEKAALTEWTINSVVMGANMSAQPPRISKDKAFIYYNIKDKDDKNFENGAKNILDNCNKMFNVDLAEKVYPQKATLEEYNQADPA